MVVIDMTETQTERHKKNKNFYSGKRKQHTRYFKGSPYQVTKEIICPAHSKVREHDLGIFKESKVRFHKGLECLADKGYQGIDKLHSHSCIPQKMTRKAELSAEDTSQNSVFAQKRIVVDRVHRKLKVFGFYTVDIGIAIVGSD